jgi:putative drug exporter of the RND superfamily
MGPTFIVRVVLLPSVLELLGRRTWAFPSWLERRLPRLALDPTPAPAGAGAITGDAALESGA